VLSQCAAVELEEFEGAVVVVVVGGLVVVVTGTVVEVVDDVVVGVTAGEVAVVLEDGGTVVAEETPFTSPPTVVPELGPPNIDDRELPAASSMTVTIPKATTNAARADTTPIVAKRIRRLRRCSLESAPVRVSGRTGAERAEEDGSTVE
jgi:hypothetical protein